jgi:hypothetical protein
VECAYFLSSSKRVVTSGFCVQHVFVVCKTCVKVISGKVQFKAIVV